ncbi:MAG TPA: chemotaxis protein CheB [Longimicrobiales bacterium]|nr:chemotaxis protein CheB [Longimicrobiales bacterium]
MTTRSSPPVPPPPVEAATAPLAVVGIGASAGGLKALQRFVEGIPADSGMAFVVILHLDPERESRMGELLQDRARIPVTQISGDTTLAADQIYVIPPTHDLAVHGGTLVLHERGERSEHAPVDLFFRTLAEAYGGDSAGVIMSGTGVDGTAGIRYVRQAGGITVAQSPDEAEYDGMPASAIATGLVDLVLPSSRIAAELVRLRRLPTLAVEGNGAAPDAEAGLGMVMATLRSRTGHDFGLYKRSTVLRRLERRLRFHGVSTLAEYLPLLQSSSAECQALLRDLLISVSSFFRDPDAFEALAVLAPSLYQGKGPADTVRVWVVGCATGEEVYSIAMVLAEHAATLGDPPRLQLFATDIDEKGYAWARAGLYDAAAIAGITSERLRRFFTKEAGGYRIAKSLRELVLFAGHNVLHDPPFSRIDLISCRNLFIYLQTEAQERVLETFHFALNPGGLLFLGASESVNESGLFAASPGTTQRLFHRSAAPFRIAPRVSAADPLPQPGVVPAPAAAHAAAPATGQRFSYGALHLRMLEQYAPASVVVDERLEVVHLSAGADRFLRLHEGPPSHNVLELVRDDLRRVLRTALHHAFGDRVATTRQVRMDIDGARRQVNVQVRPSPSEVSGDGFALVMFEILNDKSEPTGPRERPSASAVEAELEAELSRTTDLLEAASAAHDQTVAELQTLNEELQSINEEQRAATEELETSREEIQSINEELTTINQEYQSTIEELKHTNADLQNLIESTEIGTIFLDRAMRIRRYTPAATSLFNFVAADQGRPLAHITHRLRYPELVADVASVLASLVRIEREVESDAGESFIVGINPYRSLDGGHDGIVLTLFDNTAQHLVEEQLREAKGVAEAANLAKGRFLSTLSHEFRTPLTAILGYADLLLLDGRLDVQQNQRVERIKAGSWHLASMIEEILSFAKLDGGHEVVQPEPMDARLLAREAGELIEPAAAAKRLAFVLDLPDAPVALVTDHGKARQILINLGGNAVKYTPSGEVRLRVRAVDAGVAFEVIDSGVGIAAEHQARIFERFWQVDGGSTRAAGGMGIGLAAAREYARLLGGDVEVRSEPGRGSTFQLTLPEMIAVRG